MNMRLKNDGFTMLELMIVVGILATVITGMTRLYIQSSVHAELAGHKTIAVSEAQTKIEEIRKHSFDAITTNYVSGGTPGNTFDLTNSVGKGVIYIDSGNPELLVLEVVVSWQNKYNRVVGEDQDLDGVLDSGEDLNSNGKLDSPVTVMSMITRR